MNCMHERDRLIHTSMFDDLNELYARKRQHVEDTHNFMPMRTFANEGKIHNRASI